MEAVQWIIDRGLGVTGLAVIGYFLKYYFDNIHQRINDIQASNDLKFTEIINRITNIEGKNKDVLDIVLEKFSRWEDRILTLISKMDKLTPDQISKEITTIKQSAKEEINDVKLHVHRINLEMKKIANEPYDEKTKKLLLDRMETQREYFEEKIKSFDDSYLKLVKAVTMLNERQKTTEMKVENLSGANKVKLK